MMQLVQCFDMTTCVSGAGVEIIECSKATGPESWSACVELAPARNLHAGQDSLAGAVLPAVSGQSSV
jgi:hypothetical protein